MVRIFNNMIIFMLYLMTFVMKLSLCFDSNEQFYGSPLVTGYVGARENFLSMFTVPKSKITIAGTGEQISRILYQNNSTGRFYF